MSYGNSIDAMARGPEGQCLLEFARRSGVGDLWEEPAVRAIISGNNLSSLNGSEIVEADGFINNELLIHLSGHNVKATFNLSVLVSMAAAYCALARTRMRKWLKEKHLMQNNKNASKGKKPAKTKVKAGKVVKPSKPAKKPAVRQPQSGVGVGIGF